MLEHVNNSKKAVVNIVVLTPLGAGGKGGIDRVMDYVRENYTKSSVYNINLKFITTRGKGSLARMPLYMFLTGIILIYLRLVNQVDLVHINLSSHGSVWRKVKLAKLCSMLGLPYVIHLHGSRFRQYWDNLSKKRSKQLQKMFEHSTSIYVLGRIWKVYIEGKGEKLNDKCMVLPNATPHHVQVSSKKKNGIVSILFLGLLGARKGTPELIEALSMIKPKQEWFATIGGNGDVEGSLSIARKFGVCDKVDFPGWVGPADVQKLLDTSDILVLPSHDENLPMSVIEGMAAGLAVLTTPVGATEDIILHGKTGLLVPPGDVSALAAALSKLIDSDSLRQELGQHARIFHDNYLEIEGYCERLQQLWMDSVNLKAIEKGMSVLNPPD
ncbi:MAG: glycosyltransferase family 4 protein [Oceanospirillales bacterium]|nr:glycosyltransferase family 4 protein [Oceanospirillales bacterium]